MSVNIETKNGLVRVSDMSIHQSTGAAEGDVLPQQVLEGKTFSSSAGKGLVGTMPNNKAYSAIITSPTEEVVIPQGYHNGNGRIRTEGLILPPSTLAPITFQVLNRYVNNTNGYFAVSIPINAVKVHWNVDEVTYRVDGLTIHEKTFNKTGNGYGDVIQQIVATGTSMTSGDYIFPDVIKNNNKGQYLLIMRNNHGSNEVGHALVTFTFYFS